MEAQPKTKACPEFPWFGASYPDAACIDGYLWDLDSGDEPGMVSIGGDDPCPFCNTEEFIEQNIDDEDGRSREQLEEYVKRLRLKYGPNDPQ